MRRIGLAVAFAFALMLAPLVPYAQQTGKVWRIGALSTTSASGGRSVHTALVESLHRQGYVEGRNILIEWRFADGDVSRFSALSAEMVRLKVDAIFVISGQFAIAAQRATLSIPIIFIGVTDPVALGLVKSLAHPGGNATGLSNVHVELTQKRLGLLKELLPGARRVGVLQPPGLPDIATYLVEIRAAARALDLDVHVEALNEPERFERTFLTMRTAGVAGVMLIPDPLSYTYRARLAELSQKARLPLVGWTGEFANSGALLAYGPSTPDMARQAAVYIDKIFKGAKPEDLPVEQPTKFDLVINLKTAKSLGLTIPQTLLLQADQVIE